MLSLARVRRSVVVVAAGALVVASVGSSVPVLALSDGSQSPEIAVEQAEIGTGNSFGVEGPVVAGVSSNFASVLAPKTASVFNPSNTFGTGVTPQIAAGGYHTCALLNTGAVNCWGRNFYGQLGDGTTTDSSAPVAVATFTDGSATAVSITAGLDHTCALLNTGAVNCWGQNNSGQLGDGNDTNTDSSVPVAVAAFTVGSATAVSITAGDFHTCALLNTGAVNCWGYNGFGQLGNNTNTDSSASVAVAAFTDVSATAVSITAGSNHTCAVLNTGAVNCWGNNSNGQLGNNTNGSSSRSAPVAVSAFTDVSATAVSITAGNSHTCVVLNTGAVNCWGWNNFGQLGNNTNASSFVPVAVATFTVGSATAVSITAGFGHTCALLSTGAVNCWGYNSFGGLGNNTNASSFVPVAVAAFTVGSATAVSITADAFHTCALLSTGAVNCWGFNGNGQLGNNTTTDSSVPVAVAAFTVGSATAVSITAGNFHTCALLNTGAVNCWGSNSDGQLGNNTTTSSSVPVAVAAFTDGATAVSITAGDYHTCALLNTGAVNCWGSNDDGQLGNNTTTDSSAPVAVDPFTDVSGTAVSITAGRFHTCAVLNTGAVNCWGWNIFGQLGNGTTTSSSVPVAVSAFTDGATAVSITAGDYHTCALLNTGAVNCWGLNGDGQLGNNTTTSSSVPVAVAAFTDGATAVSITAGHYHTCALLNTGAVNCWGNNGDGELGNNTTTSSSVPVAVSAFTDVTATAVSITAGLDHTCALLNTGAVNCWGRNFYGQLGNNTNTDSSAPVAVAAFTVGSATAVSITAGYFHTCALLNTGAVNCWGSNSDGQLGNGNTTNSSVPAKVMLFVPGVPTGVSGVAGDSEVVVSWTAPISDGGSVISSYTATSSPHNKTCTTTGALTCTVAGLTNATAYTFTVAATNTAGAGPASTASGAATPVTVPGVPTGVSGVAGDSEVIVSWTAPISDGGSVISSYKVTSSPHNKTCTTTGALTCTVAGLTNATAYTFTVAATNFAGTGLASTASGAATPVASLVALAPSRLLETRSGLNDLTVDGSFQGNGRRGAGTTLELTVTDRGGVPNNAGAVMLNVTAVSPGAAGFLTVFPCGTEMPLASSVNYGPGDVVANAVLAKIGTGGKVCIYSPAATDIVVDVTGYIAAGSLFGTVVPGRLLDTRSGPNDLTVDGSFQGNGRRSAGTTLELTVTGRGGVPNNAGAVMLNVTAVSPSAPGFLTVFPCGTEMPLASSVNYGPGDVVANAVLAKIGTGGKVCIYSPAATDIVVDVTGYIAAGSLFGTVVPGRLLETRSGPNDLTVDGSFQGNGRRSAGTTLQLTVTGRGGVPNNAGAVMLNVTAVSPSAPGFLTVFPCGTTMPLASSVNYGPGDVVANAVLAKIGTGGKVCIYSPAATDIVVDVTGYIPAG